jgi:hypothetical protein
MALGQLNSSSAPLLGLWFLVQDERETRTSSVFSILFALTSQMPPLGVWDLGRYNVYPYPHPILCHMG